MCEIMSPITRRSIAYQNVSDPEFERLLVREAGMTPEQAEIGVICHFRAWRNGGAEVRTDTYRELTGHAPTTVEEWITAHRDTFAQARDKATASR
jgi:hypothetical protein